MSSAAEPAKKYRKEAQIFLELAGRISLNGNRARLVEMSQHWLRLAEIAEAKAERGEDAD